MFWLLALDLGSRMGVARGQPSTPIGSAIFLKKPSDPQAVAFGNLIHWLNGEFQLQRPNLVVVEDALHLGAFAKLGNSEQRIRMDFGLHGIVQGMCNRFGVSLIAVNARTVRKHFIGTGASIARNEVKRMVVARCQQLSLLAPGQHDEDMADAFALFDWAAYTHCRTRPLELTLFKTEQNLPKRKKKM